MARDDDMTHADTPDVPTRAIRTRTVVLGLVVGLPVSALFLWLAIRGVDLSQVWAAVTGANLWLVLLAVPFANLLMVFQGFRWRHLVEADQKPGNPVFVALMLVGGAITNARPPPIFRVLGGTRSIGGSRTPLAR